MKRNSNIFKQNLEVEDIKIEIAKNMNKEIEKFARDISQELPKKIADKVQEEK